MAFNRDAFSWWCSLFHLLQWILWSYFVVDFTAGFKLFTLQHQLGNTMTLEEAGILYTDGRERSSLLLCFAKGTWGKCYWLQFALHWRSDRWVVCEEWKVSCGRAHLIRSNTFKVVRKITEDESILTQSSLRMPRQWILLNDTKINSQRANVNANVWSF